MPGIPKRLSRFWKELRQRRVIRVLVVYVAVGFAVIEFVDIVTEPLSLPSWALTLVIVLVSVGLPIVLVLAWAYDITPEGIRKSNANGPASGEKDLNHLRSPGDQKNEDLQDPIRPNPPREHSIVILPFEDMSPEKDNEYFCDGITEEIINALTKIEDLHVVARTSAFAFKGQSTDVREIGRKLGVAKLLEGSVRKSGNQLRITAQLINIENGYQLWSERYDRDLSDIFEIQDDISMQIVSKLKISIGAGDEKVLFRRYTENLEAFNLYLKGRYFWNRLTEDGLHKSLDFFRQAIQIDKNYAPAYSGISDAYCRLAWYSYSAPQEVFPGAKEAAGKALELDDHLPEAYASLGFVSMCFDRDYEKAMKELKKAIDLNPGFAGAHTYYSICLAITGLHEESIREGKRALNLDPLTPMMYVNLAGRYYYARQYHLCIEHVKQSLELDPEFEIAHFYLAYFYNQWEMHTEALAEIQKLIGYFGRKNPAFLSALAIILASSGNTEAAEEVIDEIMELSREKYISFFWLATIFVVVGQYDKAFELFEEAYQSHEVLMIFLNVDPIFDRIKPDQRFQALIKKMNFIL
ncbi:MAG TPA: tetratricopeptide repeat protein [Bacteroides sp.]|nr:tetratricopeptide repeat protein [Bacteroides sp.]